MTEPPAKASDVRGNGVDVEAELASLSTSPPPQKFRGAQIKGLLNVVLRCLLFFALGLLLLGLAVSFRIPWLSAIIALGGLGIVLVTPIMIVMAFRSFFRGARMRTPEETVRSFYSYGVLGGLGAPENHERAWICLTPIAQRSFGTMEGFKNYWKTVLKALADRAKAIGPEVKNIRVVQKGSNSSVVHFDFVAKEPQVFKMKGSKLEIPMGGLAWAQTKVLVKSNEKWYLTSGTVDLPAYLTQARESSPSSAAAIANYLEDRKKNMKLCQNCQSWIPMDAESCHVCNASYTAGPNDYLLLID